MAVLLVVLFHYDVGSFTGGYIGVDVFFVISGFLITRNIVQDLERGRFTLAGFYYRRIRRLFPALLVTVALTSVFAVLLFSAEHLQRYAASSIFAVFSLSNVFFWSEAGYFDTSAAFKPLLHFWSLAVEEQFYLVWPLMLLLFFRSHRALVIASGLLACGAVSMLAAEWLLPRDAAAAFYLTPFRIMEFSLGAVCVWVNISRIGPRLREILFLAALVTIVACAAMYDERTPFPGLNSFLPCLAAAGIIVTSESRVSRLLLGNRAAVQIGLVSYSLYLVHWPLWVFYGYWKKLPIMTYQALMVLAVALALAFAMHRFIERPIRLHGNRTPRLSGPRFFIGTAALMLALNAPALHAWRTGGWNWRAPEPGLAGVLLAPMACERPGGGSYQVRCTIRPEQGADRRVLVIGDSHADHLQAAMRYLAARHGFEFDFLTHRGCPPLSGTFRMYGELAPPYQDSCRAMVPQWERVIDDGDYDAVVLAARWMSLYEDAHYAGGRLRRDYLADAARPVADIGASRRLFTERLERTIERIHAAGARAVVFSQVPLLGRDIAGCSDRPWLIPEHTPVTARCDAGVGGEEQLRRLEFTDRQVGALASAHTLAVLYSQYLCEPAAGTCTTLLDGRGLYRDSHHLSDEGSYLLALRYGGSLADFVRGTREE